MAADISLCNLLLIDVLVCLINSIVTYYLSMPSVFGWLVCDFVL